MRLGTVVNELVKAFIDEVVKRRFKGLHHRKEGSTETVDENEPLEEEVGEGKPLWMLIETGGVRSFVSTAKPVNWLS